VPGAVTFVLSLTIGVELGLLVGVLTDLAFVVYRTARPEITVDVSTVRCEFLKNIFKKCPRLKENIFRQFPASNIS
jgi:MFS superfamily sulfate permease-like transporter